MNSDKQPSKRQLQISEQIKKVLSQAFIKKEFKGAIIEEIINISEVRISQDLKNATIFISPLGGTDKKQEFLTKIELIAKELKNRVAKDLVLKFCPKLHFKYDDLFEKASKIEDIFCKIKQEEPQD